ncbi:hypothetical protein [Streptomyces noursei]|uniref:hypothetical protein n=1 Tax=Streptomyces noursei TaxID=1971 RepID=UPI0023B7A1F5|nr:hypothetical protein [Streptomyces noursei]
MAEDDDRPCDADGKDAGGQPACTKHKVAVIPVYGRTSDLYRCGTEIVYRKGK